MYDEMVIKTYSDVVNKFTVQDGNREFVATISTDDVDRDGDIIDPKGIDLKNYKDNPIILLQHEAWDLPIGKATTIQKFTNGGRSGIMAKGLIAEGTQRAEEAFSLMQQGILSKTSIGFGIVDSREPTDEERKSKKGLKRVITKSEMYEFSIVAIPSNTSASIEQVSKYPDWLRPEPKQIEINEIEEKEEVIDMTPVVALHEPVSLEELVEIKEVETAEQVAAQATKEAVALYEVKKLGKVIDD